MLNTLADTPGIEDEKNDEELSSLIKEVECWDRSTIIKARISRKVLPDRSMQSSRLEPS